MLLKVNVALPGLDSVTVCCALVVPTGWFANARLVAESATKGPVMPVPESGTKCGLPAASSVIVT